MDSMPPPQPRTFFDRFGRKPRYAVPTSVLLGLLASALYPLLLQKSVIVGVIMLFTWQSFFFGLLLLGLGGRRWVGDSEHCASCDNEKAVGAPGSARCPECDAAWNEPGATARGRFTRNRLQQFLGVALLLFGLWWFLSNPGRIGPLAARALPTGVLLDHAGTRVTSVTSVWNELERRSLTEEQRHLLAEDLLNRRLQVRYFSATPGAPWLEQQIRAGMLRPDLVDRFYQELLDLQLEGPLHTRMGEPVTVALRAEHRLPSQGWTETCYAMIEGFRVGDSDQPIGRSEEAIAAVSLDNGTGWNSPAASVAATPRRPQTVTFTPERAGIMRVWFSAQVIVLGPDADPAQISWDESGALSLPATGVVWCEHVERMHEVHVRADDGAG